MSRMVKRILIADSHPIVRMGMRGLLEDRPNLYVVSEAGNGRAALDEARLTQPDIAVIEYALSELNGLDLIIALQREFPRTEVLVYTTHDREDLIIDVLRAGARGYVLKSDPETDLLAAVDALSLHKPYYSKSIPDTLLDRFCDVSVSTQLSLTHRERQIVQLIAEGKINKEIASLLEVSVKTIETHRASAMNKLKFRTTAQLVRYALRNGIAQV